MNICKANWLITATLVLIAQLPLYGQEARGTLLGRVSDPTGAVIVGAKVEGSNTATGVRVETTTNRSGDYVLPFLVPGSYTVAVEAPGFSRFVRSEISLRVNDRLAVDVTLQLGQTSESVEVVGMATLLDTSTTSMGQVLDSKTILDLPIQHGNLMWAVTMSPGVVDTNANAGYVRPYDTSHPTSISVDGTRVGSNQYTIDGAPNMMGTVFAYSPPPGIVDEFKVVGTSFDASYGYMSGASVNMSLKSGTNRPHGEMYWFHQTPTLGANQFFANRGGTPRVGFRLHRWGINASGPAYIPKVYDGQNKTFWMFGYEGMRSWDPSSGGIESVPTAAERGGDFSALLALGSKYQIYDPFTIAPASGGRFSRQPLSGNIIPPTQISPLASNIAKLWDAPNLSGTADGTNNYTFGKDSHDAYYNYVGRVDYNLSAMQRFYVRAHKTRNARPQHYRHNGAEGWEYDRSNTGAAADYVYTISPTFFINSRYSYTRYRTVRIPVDMGFDLSGLLSSTYINQIKQANPGGLRLPAIVVTGYSALANQASLSDEVPQTHDFGLNGALMAKAHTVRFGFGYRVVRQNMYNLDRSSGRFYFAMDWTRGPFNTSGAAPMGQGLASFLYDLPTRGYFPLRDSYAEQAVTSAFYIQDDWKLSTKLTLSVGLRYELPGGTTERFNRSVRGFDWTASSPIEAQAKANYAANPIPQIPVDQFQVKGGLTFAGVNGAPRDLWNTPKTNLMPRIGFAYSVTPQLVVRGGVGIFYEPVGVVTVDVDQTGFSLNTEMTPSVDNGQNFIATMGTNPFPNGFLPPLKAAGGLATNLGSSVSFFNQSLKSPYMERWQLAVQRGLPGNAMLEVSYVGNRGVRQRMSRNYDALPNQYLSTSPFRDQPTIDFLSAAVSNPFYPLLPGTSRSGTTVSRSTLLTAYPQFTGVTRDENQGYSWYHGLQARFEKRFSTGLSTSVSYTWSKLMDAMSFLNAGDPMPEEVISSGDRTQRLVVTWIYALPFGRGQRWANSTPVLSTLIGGWQLQGVYSAQSGPPLGFGDAIFLGDLKNIPLPNDQRSVDRWFNVDAGFDRNSKNALASHLRTISSRFGGIRGDGVNGADLSAVKNTRLAEGVNLQFRAEAYNALNHVQFNAPNTSPTSSAFGKITAEGSMPRNVQFALKVVF